MKEMIRNMLAARGLQIPEEDLATLATQFATFTELRESAEGLRLDDKDMVLVNIALRGVVQ